MQQTNPESTRGTTEDEYLRLEEKSRNKHEFRDGQISDMAGGTFAHGRIAANILRRLGERLDGSPCQAVGSDVRVRISRTGNYYYPDATIICGKPVFNPPDRQTTIVNPTALVEVTSPSSEGDDRGDKFTDYRRIESLEEYILISQDRASVETYYRQLDGIWAIGPSVTDLQQTVKLRTAGIEVPLAEIYAGIEFPTPHVKSESL